LNAVVVTNENFTDTYAGKLGLTPPEPAAAADTKAAEPAKESEAKPGAASVGSETDGEQDSQHPDPEKRQKLNLRFSELSKQRDTEKARADKAESEAKTAREARELAERQAAELRAKYEPPKPDELGPRPQRAQFVNDEEHAKALEEWATDKANRDRDQREANQRLAASWKEKQDALRAELPDFDAVLAKGANLEVSKEVREAILESEHGPAIVYHLSDNPEFVQALKAKTVTAALREIGKLEATQPWKSKAVKPAPAKADAPKPDAAATEISRAPAPISPLKATADVPATPVDSDGEFHGTFQQWKEGRKKGTIK
jgi:hypothetical protein